MKADEFVAALKQVAYRNSLAGTLEMMRNPPGRRPDPELVKLGAWFAGLDSQNQEQAVKAMDMAAAQSLYNVLLVLDGLLAIAPSHQRQELHLEVLDGAARRRLNDPASQQLSALFKEVD